MKPEVLKVVAGLPGFGDANCAPSGSYAAGICHEGSYVGGSANCAPSGYSASDICNAGHGATKCSPSGS